MRVRDVVAAAAIAGAVVLGVVGPASAFDGRDGGAGQAAERSVPGSADDGVEVNVPGFGPMHGTITQEVDSEG
ncbi:hypothetical protein ACIQU6_39860 [Streptomyces sp. NPDC090442]|jgi:hypothetical protein|uniref:hypothetical protein n=1 Tax=Streptomyces sp. NPDC090442 TaxID=3365962 RepID=UPI00380DD45F